MERIFFFDVDGTLMDSKSGTIPSSTITALEALQANGNKICIASGRSLFYECNPSIYFDIAWDGYVCFNGQIVYNREKKSLYRCAYPTETVEKVINKVNELGYNAMLMEEKQAILVNENMKYAKTASEYFKMNVPQYKKYDGSPIYSMVIYAPYGCDVSCFKDIEELELYPGKSDFMDCGSSDRNKIVGVNKLLEYYNEDSYVAFGDSSNDLKMMENASVSVCLGEAQDEIKNVSSYVTDDVSDDGIYNACVKYGWI